MGITPSAAVVFGVKWIMTTSSKTVTRYDEITGMAYEKALGTPVKAFIVGDTLHEIDVPDEDHDKIIDYFHGQTRGVFGVKLSLVDQWGPIDTIRNLQKTDVDFFEEMFDRYLPHMKEQCYEHAKTYLVNTTGW